MLTPTKLIDDLTKVKDELLSQIQSDRAKSVDKYVWIQKHASQDTILSEEFQKVWSDFYRLNNSKLSKKKKLEFYSIFANYWHAESSYRDLITALMEVNSKVESSFSSKIQHTKYPEMPIIDSKVVQLLGWNLPSKQVTVSSKIKETERLIERLNSFYSSCFMKDGWSDISQSFDEYLGVQDFQYTNVKKIDILLWQRDAVN